jgi:hypothetical protein
MTVSLAAVVFTMAASLAAMLLAMTPDFALMVLTVTTPMTMAVLVSQVRTILALGCTAGPLCIRVLACFLAPVIKGRSTTPPVAILALVVVMSGVAFARQPRIAISENNARQQYHEAESMHNISFFFIPVFKCIACCAGRHKG